MIAYIKILRPVQWLKNLILLFPPFLGGTILHAGTIQKAILPLVSFCLASSATYILNDILDAKNDSHHPRKKNRPISSGRIGWPAASVYAVAILTVALLLGYHASETFLLFLIAYLVVAISYSIRLKEYPIVDIFCISAGFLFRLHAGGEAFGVVISEWLFLSVFLLSVFLSTGKRLCEKESLGEGAGCHRKSLGEYPSGFLDGVMYMTGAAVMVTYTMYVIARPSLVYTVPLCCFGLFRYILRVKMGKGGDPTDSLLKDRSLFFVGLLWMITVGWFLYAN